MSSIVGNNTGNGTVNVSQCQIFCPLRHNYINFRVCLFVCVLVCHFDNIEAMYHPSTNNVPDQRVEQQHYINAMQTLANGDTERAQMETGEGSSRLVTNEERGSTLIRQQRSQIIDVSTGTVELHPENNYEILPQSTPVEAFGFYYVGVADFIRCSFCEGGIMNWNNSVPIATLVHAMYYTNCQQNIQHPRCANTNGNVSASDETQASGHSALATTDYLRLDHPIGELTQAERSVRSRTPTHGIRCLDCPYILHPSSADERENQNDQHSVTNDNVSARDEADTSGNYVSEQRINLQPNDQRVQDPLERLNSQTRPIRNEESNERTRPVYSLSTANAGLSNRPSRRDVTNMPRLNADRVGDTEVENRRNTNIVVRNPQENNSQMIDIQAKCKLCHIMPAEENCLSCGYLVFCKDCFTTTVKCSRCKGRQGEVG